MTTRFFLLLLSMLCTASLCTTAQTKTRNILKWGDSLLLGEKIISKNGKYEFVLQQDGDLKVVRVSSQQVLWSSKTAGMGVQRLVLNDEKSAIPRLLTSNNKAIWQSQTSPQRNQDYLASDARLRLVIEDNGNVAYYTKSRKIWSSYTSQPLEPAEPTRDNLGADQSLEPGAKLTSNNGLYELVFQSDWNLVLYYKPNRQVLWASNTSGTVSSRCTLQGDGNLVIYNGNEPKWSSRTSHGQNNYRLVLQDDGNAVIYNPHNDVVWSTNTAVK